MPSRRSSSARRARMAGLSKASTTREEPSASRNRSGRGKGQGIRSAMVQRSYSSSQRSNAAATLSTSTVDTSVLSALPPAKVAAACRAATRTPSAGRGGVGRVGGADGRPFGWVSWACPLHAEAERACLHPPRLVLQRRGDVAVDPLLVVFRDHLHGLAVHLAREPQDFLVRAGGGRHAAAPWSRLGGRPRRGCRLSGVATSTRATSPLASAWPPQIWQRTGRSSTTRDRGVGTRTKAISREQSEQTSSTR